MEMAFVANLAVCSISSRERAKILASKLHLIPEIFPLTFGKTFIFKATN